MAHRFAEALVLVLVSASSCAFAIDASNRYRSPRNPERRIRQTTELIVLHTTEAAARGSLKKLSERGECHYCVTEEGDVYRIVDRDREAFHAGRSMWNGKEDVDKFSIGIECVGYHDQAMPLAQLAAIRDLVAELKSMYHLTDDKVVAHSHVAYGSPNKWHANKHRGRKQCGMLFAMPSVRKVLELKSRVSYDPDVRAKRLVVGDPYLEKVLYGSVDTMRGTYGAGAVAQVPPPSPSDKILNWLGFGAKREESIGAAPPPAVAASSRVSAASSSSSGSAAARQRQRVQAQRPQPGRRVTKPAVPRGQPKTAAASKASSAKTAKSNARRKVAKPPASIPELRKQGFVLKGTVSPHNTASRIAGARWNRPDTYYTIRNKVIPGNQINPAKIEKGMGIWMK